MKGQAKRGLNKARATKILMIQKGGTRDHRVIVEKKRRIKRA